MKKRNLDTLRLYDWTKTIQDAKNQENMKLRNFSTVFHQEMNKSSMHAIINGNWGEWELTAEGTGQYPIVKCYIENGIYEIYTNKGKSTYDLKNTWIKICLKIEEDQKGTYVIANKEDTLYSINHSFHFDKENTFISTLVENLFITWFKEHRDLLNQYINAYTIQSRTLNDLSLMGWDMSYVTSFSNVNKMIQQQKSYPSNFEQKFEDIMNGIKIQIRGAFDSWEITTGGDGKNVNFICKFSEDSEAYIKGPVEKLVRFSSDAFIKIQLKLQYLKLKENEEKTIEDPTGKGNGYQVNLKVKTDYEENEESPVTIINGEYLNGNNEDLNIFVNFMFKKWFAENINQFQGSFSHFLLEETAKNQSFQWVKPTSVSYGVAEVNDENGKPSLDKSVFSVMSMVENHKNEYPQNSVDARLLQVANSEAAFNIDTPILARRCLEQGLTHMQIGTSEQFEKTKNGLYIYNKEKLQIGTVINNDKKSVPVEIDAKKFNLGIDNNQIILDLEDLRWEHSRGIIGHFNFTQRFNLRLKSGVDKLGKEYRDVLIPEADTDPIIKFTYSIEAWKQHEDFIINMVTAIAFSVAVGFIPFGEIFKKGKNFVKKRFKLGSNNNVFGDIELRPLLSEAGDSISPSPDTTSRVYNNTTYNLRRSENIGGSDWEEVIKQVRDVPREVCDLIWELRMKLLGGLVHRGLRGLNESKSSIAIDIINQMVQENYSQLPTINEFLANCVGPISWPDNSEFQVENAQLQGIYLIGGKLNKESNV
ncbi:TULIP family P47-like protein [Bacillus cereus group sp. Bc222]|uniref:TULIP family P47-like protein n=1 Tax=Bacillus cereus group sp. Bc222 TaxID=3018111 RepID=UPI0022E1B497|nr:TULIP family P47-like protein [Bacillus cereus group sp. Bc222]MDA2241740.1 TULIP family P47-like protein [Bacillus cereus group sp. Bc222]